VLSVLVVLDELLDEVQDMEMKLKRNMEKMMSICLTWVPFSELGEPNIYHDSGMFYKNVGRLNEMCILFLIHHPLHPFPFVVLFFLSVFCLLLATF